jgi:hypothetical protein
VGVSLLASERQIAANRRNAGKSTGPRSGAGKKRAGQNAFSHGLTRSLPSAAFTREVDKLALHIAGRNKDAITLVLARIAGEAHLDLERIRRAMVALIDRTSVLGSPEAPTLFPSAAAEQGCLIAWNVLMTNREGRAGSKLNHPSDTLPSSERERTTAALSFILPELVKLASYATRAAGRRDNAIRKIIKRSIGKNMRL